jgi:hypothetical protein
MVTETTGNLNGRKEGDGRRTTDFELQNDDSKFAQLSHVLAWIFLAVQGQSKLVGLMANLVFALIAKLVHDRFKAKVIHFRRKASRLLFVPQSTSLRQ